MAYGFALDLGSFREQLGVKRVGIVDVGIDRGDSFVTLCFGDEDDGDVIAIHYAKIILLIVDARK